MKSLILYLFIAIYCAQSSLYVREPFASYIVVNVDYIDVKDIGDGLFWWVYKNDIKPAISVVPYKEGILAHYDNHIGLMCPHIRDDFKVVIFLVKNKQKGE